MRRLTRAALALVVVLGCADGGVGCSDDMVRAEVTQCDSDLDCGDATICFNGECRDTRGLSVVDIEVTPLAGSGFVTQQFVQVDTSIGAQVDLPLEKPLFIDGTVKRPDDSPDLQPVPGARMHFDLSTPDKTIPGLQRRLTVYADDSGRFTAFRPAGDYVVTVWGPEAYRDPPAQFDLVFQGTISGRDFVMPRLSTLQEVVGRVLETETGPAVIGARVQYYNPLENNRAMCKVTDSLSDRTEDNRPVPAGTFELLLPPTTELRDARQVKIRVSPGPKNPFVPTMDFIGGLGTAANPLILPTGDFGAPVSQYIKISGSGAPIADAVVRMEGTVLGTNGFFNAQGTTNDQGIVALQLLPGDYVLTASPAATGPLGIAVRSPIMVRTSNDPVMSPLVVECTPRTSWTSQVLDADGVPVTEVSVKAVRLANEILAAPPPRSFEARTDAQGRFTLALDEGEWRVTLIPPPASKLPREPNIPVCVSRVAAECSRALPNAVRLKKQTTIFGVVTGRGAQGELKELVGASVDIYERSADGLSSFLAGTALSDEHGRYEVTLKKIESR